MSLQLKAAEGLVDITLEGDASVRILAMEPQALEHRVTELLVNSFSRAADTYVATGMDLGAPELVLDRMAMMVLVLDGCTELGHVCLPEAVAEIVARTPGLLHLVGKSTWSGYPTRRAQFDKITALANLIEERYNAAGAPSCALCLRPKCTCTTPTPWPTLGNTHD